MNVVSAFCGILDPALLLSPVSLLVPGELPDNLPGPAVLSEAEGADTFSQLLTTTLTAFAPEAGDADVAAVAEDKPEAKQPEGAPPPVLLPAPLLKPTESLGSPAVVKVFDQDPDALGSDLSADPPAPLPLPRAPEAVPYLALAPLPFVAPLPTIAAPLTAAPIPPAPEVRAATIPLPLPAPSGAEGDMAAPAASVPVSVLPDPAWRPPAILDGVSRDPSPQLRSPMPVPEAEPPALPPFEALAPVRGTTPAPASDAEVEVQETGERKAPAGGRVRPAAALPVSRAESPLPELVAAVRETAPTAPAPATGAPREIVARRPSTDAPEQKPQPDAALPAEPLPELPAVPIPDPPPVKAPPSGSEAPSLPVASPAAAALPATADRPAAPPRLVAVTRLSTPDQPEKPIAPETPRGEVSFVARLLPDPVDSPERVRIAAPPQPRPAPPDQSAPPCSSSGILTQRQENGPKLSSPLPPWKSPSPETPQPLRKSTGEAPERTAPQSSGAKPIGSPQRIAAAPVSESRLLLARPQEPRPTAARTFSRSAAQFVAETAPELPAAPVQQIVLRLPAAEAASEAGRPVDLVFRSNAGRLQLAVHSPDPQLAQSMRASLHELAVQLEQRGFEAAPWNAVNSSQASADQPDAGSRNGSAMNSDRDDGRSRGRDQQQQQDSPRRRAADAWREQWMRSLWGGVSV